MAKSKIPSGTKAGEHPKKWDRNPVPCKSVSNGWICGKPFGVVIHFVKGQSTPCLQEACDNEVFCPHCHNGIAQDWRGYTPYYDEQYVPKFVMITLPYNESVSELEHLTPIQITRGAVHTDPIIVRHKVWRTTPIPHSAERANPVDLGEFLVWTLFRVEAQMKWEREQKVKESEKVCRPYVAPEHADPSIPKLIRMAVKEQKENKKTEDAGNVFAQVVNRITTPSKNGKAHAPSE